MSDGPDLTAVRPGLAGVVADTTAISEQDGPAVRLTYRGYPVQELARRCRYEQVLHLLLSGELPAPAALETLMARERSLRSVDARVEGVLVALPADCHPLDALRTVFSAVGAREGTAPGAEADLALRLIALAPTVVARSLRRRLGLDPVAPDPRRGLAENLLWMSFGREPEPLHVRALERSLVLYAELGFNASTFTARAVASTGADLPAAVVAALAALGGPLHGGANEQVWRTMQRLGGPERAATWMGEELAAGRRVIGFGHRVFRRADPRAAPMREALVLLAEGDPEGARWLAVHDALVAAMAAGRAIPPNVDLAAGPAYALLGYPTEFFSALFAVGRLTGWCAHILEQRERTAIVHPLAAYVGPAPREVPQ